jgi:hypothetical protein
MTTSWIVWITWIALALPGTLAQEEQPAASPSNTPAWDNWNNWIFYGGITVVVLTGLLVLCVICIGEQEYEAQGGGRSNPYNACRRILVRHPDHYDSYVFDSSIPRRPKYG